MSYIKAEDILPKELLETIQQFVDGQLIYIPCKEKQEWGSGTNTKVFFRERNVGRPCCGPAFLIRRRLSWKKTYIIT